MAPYIVPLLVAILTYVVKVWISKLPANQRPLVEAVVRSSVSAAEQLASSQLNGPGKKQLAIELIEKQLSFMHIKVAPAVVESLIEDAVLALNLAKKAAPVATVAVPLPASKVDTKGVA
jgi:LL-H family phage holin